MLHVVVGSSFFSLLYDFFGYNQITVKEEDRHKTTFTTPWETYEYLRMPFGIMNAGATFQRAMDYAFRDPISKITIIYLDDLTIFSKDPMQHIKDLKTIFESCRVWYFIKSKQMYFFGN